MSITNWILRNESENQTHDLLFREGQIVEVQNFIIAWGFAERKIIARFNDTIRSEMQTQEDENITLSFRSFGIVFNSHSTFAYNNLIDSCYQHYRERYIEGGNARALYESLCVRNKKVYRALQNINATPQAKIRAVAHITTQIRHNIAHGRKNLDAILNQQDLLRHATYGICGIIVALRLAQEYDLLPPPQNNER